MKKVIYILTLAVFLYACGGGEQKKTTTEGDTSSIQEKIKKESKQYIAIADKSIKKIFENIPSPLEISVIIKESSVEYDNKFLNNPENYQNFDSDYKKAVNLGVYGTDLGYINIYQENQDAINYVAVIRNIANDLNIGKFFDFNTIQSLVEKSDKIDSLLLVTTKNFNSMNSHLQNENRADISGLILAGGWLEALHITLEVYEGSSAKSKVLREKIGEQKIVLSQIWTLFDKFKDKIPRMKDFYDGLKPIRDIYEQVNIKRIPKDPIVKEVDGVVYIEDQSETIVEMSDETLQQISARVTKFRNELIK